MRRVALALALFGASVAVSSSARADGIDDARCGTSCGDREPRGGVLVRSGVDEVVGLRGTLTRARGTSEDDRVVGLTISGRGEGYMARGLATGRATHFFFLGGGEGGFEGGLDLDVALGMRAPVTEHEGPFVRLGVRGWLLGNGSFYTSLFELPQGQVGWQYVRGETVVEIALRGGPVLVGRFAPGDVGETRKLGGSLEWGGHAAIHVRPAQFHFSAMRIDANETGDGSPVDLLRGDVCGVSVIALCADVMAMRGGLPLQTGAFSTATAYYGGLLVGWVPKDEP